jgi:hypothetical protein
MGKVKELSKTYEVALVCYFGHRLIIRKHFRLTVSGIFYGMLELVFMGIILHS